MYDFKIEFIEYECFIREKTFVNSPTTVIFLSSGRLRGTFLSHRFADGAGYKP